MMSRLKNSIKSKFRRMLGITELNHRFDEIESKVNGIYLKQEETVGLQNIVKEIEISVKRNLPPPSMTKIVQYLEQDDYKHFIDNLQCLNLENTNVCEYRCKMCVQKMMQRPKGFQSIDDLKWILKNITDYRHDYNGGVHLHGFGEPLLDKNLLIRCETVRNKMPNSIIRFVTTLGYKMPEGYFEELVSKGLNMG